MILIRSLWTLINFKVRRVMILEMRRREVRSRTSWPCLTKAMQED
jgi:hypothetical protein